MTDRIRLDGRVAVVTGAAGVIGTATMRLLAERGARLVAVDRRQQDLKQAIKDLPASAQALAVTGWRSDFFALGCWGYDALRAAHSAIHCTFNNVLMRFIAYLLSTLLLFALWVGFALRLAA